MPGTCCWLRTLYRCDSRSRSRAFAETDRRRCPGSGLLHHSDRGSPYASEDYQDVLRGRGITCSMSRKGHCYDNAVVESFFKTRWVQPVDATSALIEVMRMASRRRGLTAAQKRDLWRRWKEGESLSEIGRALGKAAPSIFGIVRAHGGFAPASRARCSKVLSLAEREEISRGLTAGFSLRRIAEVLGRSSSTVSREIARNGGRRSYRAAKADAEAWSRAVDTSSSGRTASASSGCWTSTIPPGGRRAPS